MPESPMGNIQIGRYAFPDTHGYAGYVQPDDASWVVFVRTDGQVQAFLERDSETGAIACPCGRDCGAGEHWDETSDEAVRHATRQRE